MADATSEYLKQDMRCEGLLECIHGVGSLDAGVFRVLTECSEPLTADEVAEAIDLERSTAYRSIQRLVQSGFVRKAQVNYEQGGYYHVFRPADAIDDDMQRLLNVVREDGSAHRRVSREARRVIGAANGFSARTPGRSYP